MDLISTQDAAELLGLTPRRVRQLREELNAVEIGGVLLFPRKRVEAEAQRERPKRGPKPKGKKKGAKPK